MTYFENFYIFIVWKFPNGKSVPSLWDFIWLAESVHSQIRTFDGLDPSATRPTSFLSTFLCVCECRGVKWRWKERMVCVDTEAPTIWIALSPNSANKEWVQGGVGMLRLCFFEGEHGKGSKTNWNMIEYRLLHHCCSIECDHRRPRVSSAAPSQVLILFLFGK